VSFGRLARFTVAGVLALLAALAVLLAIDALREPLPVPSTPVVRASAIDAWTPPWKGDPLRLASTAGDPATAAGLPKHWLVVAWDGGDWDLLLPMLEAGRLPNLLRLMRRGAYGPLATFRPTLSPVLWTTVATGEPPARHGIAGFEKPRTRVQRRIFRLLHGGALHHELYTNADRRVPAIWNLLSAEGRASLVVGYHNTFPAERLNGLMVSNYLMQEFKADTLHAAGGAAGDLDRRLYPPGLASRILPYEDRVRREFPGEIDRFAALGVADKRRLTDPKAVLDPDADRLLYFLRDAYVFDTFDAEVALEWLPRMAPDLAIVHFQALDLGQHCYLFFHDPRAYDGVALTPECRTQLAAEIPAFGGTLGAFAAYLDAWLGRLIAEAPPGTAIMVLSDHGFDPVDDCHTPGAHDEAPPGILVLAGPGVRPGTRLAGATLYDIFPTLAATLGLPLAEDLPGKPLIGAFYPGLLDPRTIRTVPAYLSGTAWRPEVPAPGEPDPEVEKRLRSLGYVK
jgi:hypothetical protein